MNYWTILDILPTNEISVIKKAYSKRLRIHHPEDDPEGFQRLKEAYDLALNYAKNYEIDTTENADLIEHMDDSVIMDDTPYPLDENINLLHKVDLLNGVVDAPINKEYHLQGFFKKAEDLYDDFFSRIEVGNWEELLNDDSIWVLDTREHLNQLMIDFLMEHHHLPEDVWRLMVHNFSWSEQEGYYYLTNSEFFMEFLISQQAQAKKLRFCYFSKDSNIDFEEYLNYRAKAFQSLLENDLESAEYNIEAAYKIYQDDPDLLCMKGEYYFRKGDNEKGDALFQDAIQINPNDMGVYLYLARVLFNHNEFSKSIDTCKYILENAPYHTEVKSLLREIASTLHSKLKWYSLNIKLRFKLEQIYILLGETIKRVRQIIINILKGVIGKFFKIVKYFLIASLSLSLFLSSNGLILIVVIVIWYLIYRKKKG